MKRILFLYRNREHFATLCEDNAVKSQIHYWLGKSPGMFIDDIEEIIVCDPVKTEDWTHAVQDYIDEQHKAEQKRNEANERQLYDKLKAKFG